MTSSAGYKTHKLPVAFRVCAYLFLLARLSRSAKLHELLCCFKALLTQRDLKKIRIHSKHVASNYELECGAASSVQVPETLIQGSDLVVVSPIHLQHWLNSDHLSPVNSGQMLVLQISAATCLHEMSRDIPRLRSGRHEFH